MLTGQRAFEGEDVSDTMAAVLRAEVNLDGLPDETPARLRQVLRACLEKDPKERVHDIADVRLAMQGTFETAVSAPSEPAAASQLQVWQRPVSLVLAALALLAVGGLAVWSFTRSAPPPPEQVARFVIPLAGDQTVVSLRRGRQVAISSDGTSVAWRTNEGIWLRPLDQLEATLIPETGDLRGRGPFVLPDGQWVGFWAGGQLRKVAMSGGHR